MGQDRPYRTGRGAKYDRPEGLVRPYVLRIDDDADGPLGEEPAQLAAHGGSPSDDRPDDLPFRRDAYETGWLDARLEEGAAPWLSTRQTPANRSAGHYGTDGRQPDREGSRGGHRRPPRRSIAAGSAALVALAVTVSVILIASRHPSPSQAAACAASRCRSGSHLTNPAPGRAVGPTTRASAHHSAAHSTVRPTVTPVGTPTPTPTPTTPTPTRPSRTPGPTGTASPSPAPSPSPTTPSDDVSYALVWQRNGGFEGKLTIVNNGSRPIRGWTLSVDLPGDQVKRVWNAQYHMVGETLIMQPSPSETTIAPGGTLIEHFIAHGATTSPTGCTFNGSPC
jgi:hypothetical protein